MIIGFYADGESVPPPPNYVEVTCRGCGDKPLLVPILEVGPDNTIHIDHDYLAAHHAEHRAADCGLVD